jgi:hypothetical protein
MKKDFSQDLFTENDIPAREVVVRSFDNLWGITLVNNPDQYGVDLVAFKDGKMIGFVEFEVKHNWVGHKFPFSTVHFPARKARIFEEHKAIGQNLPITFVILNKDMTSFMWFKGKDLVDGQRVFKKTKLTDWKEEFIEVQAIKGQRIKSA